MGFSISACFGLGKVGMDTHVTKSAISKLQGELKKN